MRIASVATMGLLALAPFAATAGTPEEDEEREALRLEYTCGRI